MYPDAFLLTCPFKHFSQSLYVGNYHVNVIVVVVALVGPIVIVGLLLVCWARFTVVLPAL